MSGETGRCGTCGEDWQLKGDGTLYKHSIQGVTCEGSGQKPEEPVAEAANVDGDAGDDGDDGLDETGDDDDAPPVQPEQAPAEHPAATTPVRDLGYGKGGYDWPLTVRKPCPYLDEPSWHQANARMAGADAEAEGHTVLGEAQCTSVAAGAEDGTLALTYTVPVKS